MKFLHISDLHLGKRVSEFSMLEDQKYILNRILKIAESKRLMESLLPGTFTTDRFLQRRRYRFLTNFSQALQGWGKRFLW